MRTPYCICTLSIESVYDLETTAKLISERLVGGLPFGGKDRNICDEVPAIFLATPILGFKVILLGTGGLDGCDLVIRPDNYPYSKNEVYPFWGVDKTDLSEFIKHAIGDIDGISISVPEYKMPAPVHIKGSEDAKKDLDELFNSDGDRVEAQRNVSGPPAPSADQGDATKPSSSPPPE